MVDSLVQKLLILRMLPLPDDIVDLVCDWTFRRINRIQPDDERYGVISRQLQRTYDRAQEVPFRRFYSECPARVRIPIEGTGKHYFIILSRRCNRFLVEVISDVIYGDDGRVVRFRTTGITRTECYHHMWTTATDTPLIAQTVLAGLPPTISVDWSNLLAYNNL